MQLPGIRGQAIPTRLLDASGGITDNSKPQLALPERRVCSYLQIENIDATHNLWVEFGSARATATLTSGVVTSCSITNGGFGFTIAPTVTFMGGGVNSVSIGVGLPNFPSPQDTAGPNQAVTPGRAATGRAILTSGVVTSIVIDEGGSGYGAAPYVLLTNNPKDPFGCADPSLSSGTGVLLLPGGSLTYEDTTAITDAVAVWGGTTNQRFMIKWLAS